MRELIVDDHQILMKKMSNPIKLFYWTKRRNFGDLLSPHIVSYVSGGREVVWANRRRAELLALGSLGEIALPHQNLWGTGVQHPQRFYAGHLPNPKQALVRGPLSEYLFDSVGKEAKCVGDPALLLPRFHQPPPGDTGTVVIQHHTRGEHLDPELSYVDRIANARAVISSSLHGLIVADAYGVPSAWLWDRPTMHRFKFYDYFMSQGRPIEWCTSIESAKPSWGKNRINLDHLEDVFPL